MHHKLQRKDGGDNSPENLVEVDSRLHQFYHAFFASGTYPPDMARKLNDWIRPDWCLIAIPKEDVRKVKNLLTQLVH
jgi:hypothetical protein